VKKFNHGQIDTGRLDMPGIFHKHAKYRLGYKLRVLENQRWVFSFSEKLFNHGQIDPGRRVIPGIFHTHAKYTLHTYGLIKPRLGFSLTARNFWDGQIHRAEKTCPRFSKFKQSTHYILHPKASEKISVGFFFEIEKIFKRAEWPCPGFSVSVAKDTPSVVK
jgi:hypothetical protein